MPIEKCNDDWFSYLCNDFANRGSDLRLDLIKPDGNSIIWLDLQLRWGDGLGPSFTGGKVCASCWIKPSNLGLYVPADSGHSCSVLRTWPRAEFSRIVRNSMRLSDVWLPVERLRKCLRDRLYPEEIVLSYSDDYIINLWHRRLVARPAVSNGYSSRILPFVLPFHPVWSRLRLCNKLCRLSEDLDFKARPIVCFSNPSRHLFIVVRNYARGG